MLLLSLLAICGCLSAEDSHIQLTSILAKGIEDSLFPGAVAYVGSLKSLRPLYAGNVGHFTNDSSSPAMKVDGEGHSVLKPSQAWQASRKRTRDAS